MAGSPDRRLPLQPDKSLTEGDRLLTICNACRYCEGYCAVFPAMERRTGFTEADVRYLANLCHNCAECYYACQYAPPHEFSVNLPKTLAEIRLESYQRYTWPAPFAAAFRRNGLIVSLVVMLSLAAAMFATVWIPRPRRAGDFYAVVPHEAMVAMFGAVSAEAGRDGRRSEAHSATCCGFDICRAADSDAPIPMSIIPRLGAGFIISLSMGLRCALPRHRWPQSIITLWDGSRRMDI